jgi:hypothetical protein
MVSHRPVELARPIKMWLTSNAESWSENSFRVADNIFTILKESDSSLSAHSRFDEEASSAYLGDATALVVRSGWVCRRPVNPSISTWAEISPHHMREP